MKKPTPFPPHNTPDVLLCTNAKRGTVLLITCMKGDYMVFGDSTFTLAEIDDILVAGGLVKAVKNIRRRAGNGFCQLR
jgi:hypothetical protein